MCSAKLPIHEAPVATSRYRTYSVLTLIAMALLAGRREISEIARFGYHFEPAATAPVKVATKEGNLGAFWQVPSYSVFYQVLTRMDPEAVAQVLNGWLESRTRHLCPERWRWMER